MNKATNTVGYQPNWANIAQLVEQGYIREVQHPDDPELHLYNYTPQAQFEQHWTEDVLICRGLITRGTGEHRRVIARPFPKFFNWQELEGEHLKGPWQVYEKMDGSLGILYEFAQGDYRVATRGSFTSDQAMWATRYFKENLPVLEYEGIYQMEGDTWLFEIIYPENRIVVDYSDSVEGLVFLDCLNDVGFSQGAPCGLTDYGITYADYHGIQDSIPTDQRNNKEGYVLVNDQGFRVKVKHEEYVRLHRILTNTSSVTVWEYLSNPEKDFNELLDNVPDEFYDWVKKVKRDLEEQFEDIRFETELLFLKIDLQICPETRKGYAMLFQQHPHPSILFNMLDGKDYSGLIWKLIKPERTLPFTNEAETDVC